MRKTLLKAAVFGFVFMNGFLWAEAPYLDVYDPDNIQGGAQEAASQASHVFDGTPSVGGAKPVVQGSSGTNGADKKAVVISAAEDKRKALQVARHERNGGIVVASFGAVWGGGFGSLLGYGIFANREILYVPGLFFGKSMLLFGGILGVLGVLGLLLGGGKEAVVAGVGGAAMLGLGTLGTHFPAVVGGVILGAWAFLGAWMLGAGIKETVQSQQKVNRIQKEMDEAEKRPLVDPIGGI